MRARIGFVILIGLALAAVPAFAAESKPDFSGEWKVNLSKSDFGPLPAPTSRVDKIDHKEPKLKVAFAQVSDQGEMNGEVNYTTDGKDCTNEIGEAKFTSVLKWAEKVLTFETKGSFRDFEFESKEDWTLSADGKVLSVKRRLSSAMGEAEQTVIMEKQ